MKNDNHQTSITWGCPDSEMKIIMVKSSSVHMWCWQWTRAPQLDILVAAWARAEATAKKEARRIRFSKNDDHQTALL